MVKKMRFAEVEAAIIEIAMNAEAVNSGLLCLISNQSALSFIEPMPRAPEPAKGFILRDDFGLHIKSAIKLNPSIHDGAMVGSKTPYDDEYELIYWSCRLFPPKFGDHLHINRGSAFNSAIAASNVDGFDAVYFWSNGAVWKFERGIASKIACQSEAG